MKIILTEDHNDLVLYTVTKEGRDYCESVEEFSEFIKYIGSSKFKILHDNNDLILKGANNSYTFRIRNYESVFRFKECQKLIEIIDRVYERDGAVDITDRKNISSHHNHSNKHARDKVIKWGAGLLATIALTTAIIGNVTDKKEVALPDDNHVIAYIQDEEDATRKIEDYLETTTIQNFDTEVPDDTEIVTDSISNGVVVSLGYDNNADTEKAIKCREEYGDLIASKAKMFLIDPDLMIAIATQERGTHSTTIDSGGGVGLMQLQYNVWVNEDLTAYKLNPETNEMEKVVYHITDNMLRNLDSNVELSCAYMQWCLWITNYNIPMSIQMYNQGYNSVHAMLEAQVAEVGGTRADICNHPENLDWMKHTAEHNGDPDYLPNVLQWYGGEGFTCTDYQTGKDISVVFNNTRNLGR